MVVVDFSVFITKISTIVCIVLFDTGFILIPIIFSQFKQFTAIMPWINLSSAGLMMGLSILELVNDDPEIDDVVMSYVCGIVFTSSFLFSFFAHHYASHKEAMKKVELTLTRDKTVEQQLILRLLESRMTITATNSVQMVDKNDEFIQLDKEEDEQQQVAIVDIDPIPKDESLRSLLFWVITISADSFFSCIVLGCQTKSKLVWIIFTSIVSSDWATCIILGQRIHQHFRHRSAFTQMFVVVLIQVTNVSGFLVGILVEMFDKLVQDTISKVLFAALSGLYLYISVIDMMLREMHASTMTRRHFLLKCLVIYGGLLMAILMNVFLSE